MFTLDELILGFKHSTVEIIVLVVIGLCVWQLLNVRRWYRR